MRNIPFFLMCCAALVLLTPWSAAADDLTRIIQEDLVTLGYEPGNTDGELTTKTVIAISKYQAENDMEVTGEATPQLAGIIKAQIKQGAPPTVANNSSAQTNQAAAAEPNEVTQAKLQAAQQACLQEKMEQAQSSQKKKRGFGSLMRAVSRTASQLGNSGVSREIARTSNAIYSVNATAADLESAAKDLGVSEEDIEECRNP